MTPWVERWAELTRDDVKVPWAGEFETAVPKLADGVGYKYPLVPAPDAAVGRVPAARLTTAERGLPSPWTLLATLIAAIVAGPIVALLSSLATPPLQVWAHPWRTQLGELIGNTLLLLVGVGGGTMIVVTGLAWLVVGYRFPGRAVFEWALMLPLAVPAYVIGFAFLGLFDYAGPVQTALRHWLGGHGAPPRPRAYGGGGLIERPVFFPARHPLAPP